MIFVCFRFFSGIVSIDASVFLGVKIEPFVFFLLKKKRKVLITFFFLGGGGGVKISYSFLVAVFLIRVSSNIGRFGIENLESLLFIKKNTVKGALGIHATLVTFDI